MYIKNPNLIYFFFMLIFGIAFERFVKHLFPDTGMGYILSVSISWVVIWVVSYVSYSLIKVIPFISTRIIFSIVICIGMCFGILAIHPQVNMPSPLSRIIDSYKALSSMNEIEYKQIYNMDLPNYNSPYQIVAQNRFRDKLPKTAFLVQYTQDEKILKSYTVESTNGKLTSTNKNVIKYKYNNVYTIKEYFRGNTIEFKLADVANNDTRIQDQMSVGSISAKCYRIAFKSENNYNTFFANIVETLKPYLLEEDPLD